MNYGYCISCSILLITNYHNQVTLLVVYKLCSWCATKLSFCPDRAGYLIPTWQAVLRVILDRTLAANTSPFVSSLIRKIYLSLTLHFGIWGSWLFSYLFLLTGVCSCWNTVFHLFFLMVFLDGVGNNIEESNLSFE